MERSRGSRGSIRWLVCVVSVLSLVGVAAFSGSASATLQLLKPDAATPATFVGHGGYSADGLGQDGIGGTVQAEVPTGSTVVHAYLYGSYFGNTAPSVGDRTITLDSTAVVLDTLPNSEAGNSQLSTARADVTAQVAAKVGSGGGITDFTVNTDPADLDGVALVVVYSNPASPEVTVAVLDGGSKQAGDQVTLNFASPIHPAASGFDATMSLGSGYSYQNGIAGHACGGDQYSTVSVNGQPLTSCAGNFDDGYGADGGLITVGGVGDSTDNPADGTATTSGTDDELYNLKPFLHDGDTSLVLDTQNPSSDDNLFLSVIAITAQARVTTEICNDGIDNDGDGLIDAADPDCATTVHNLAVNVVGAGSVTSSPSGITCPTVCTNQFGDGSTVALTSTPASGSTFVGWSGACSGTGPCSVTMNADQSVTATFASGPATGEVEIEGDGHYGHDHPVKFDIDDVQRTGAGVLEGHMKFSSKSRHLSFKSTQILTLDRLHNVASFTATGSLNDHSGYTVSVTGVDMRHKPTPSRISIELRNASGALVFTSNGLRHVHDGDIEIEDEADGGHDHGLATTPDIEP